MHKKYVSWAGTAKAPKYEENMTPDGEVLRIIYSISSELSINPRIFISDGNILWAYFENSSVSTRWFIERYGELMAFVSEKYHMSLYGSVNGYESGQVTARFSEDKNHIDFVRLDETSVDFDEVVDVCIKLSVGDGDVCTELSSILKDIDYTKDFLPVERTRYTSQNLGTYPQYSEDTYFRYIALDEVGDENRYTDSLSIKQKRQMWTLFLEDGISPLEFDNILRQRKDHTAVLFSWELALKLAMGEMGMSVSYEDGFKVINKDGGRRKFDYEKGSSAERLFLKILFPDMKK